MTVGALRSLQGIANLCTIPEEFVWQILSSFFKENAQWQYLEHEIWRTNKFC